MYIYIYIYIYTYIHIHSVCGSRSRWRVSRGRRSESKRGESTAVYNTFRANARADANASTPCFVHALKVLYRPSKSIVHMKNTFMAWVVERWVRGGGGG